MCGVALLKSYGKLKMLGFLQYFFNKDISLSTLRECLKSCKCIVHDYLEGIVPDIVYIGPSLKFM